MLSRSIHRAFLFPHHVAILCPPTMTTHCMSMLSSSCCVSNGSISSSFPLSSSYLIAATLLFQPPVPLWLLRAACTPTRYVVLSSILALNSLRSWTSGDDESSGSLRCGLSIQTRPRQNVSAASTTLSMSNGCENLLSSGNQ